MKSNISVTMREKLGSKRGQGILSVIVLSFNVLTRIEYLYVDIGPGVVLASLGEAIF